MMRDGSNYYEGKFQTERLPKGTALAGTFENINPCTGETIGSFPKSTSTEVHHVCDVAKKAFGPWSRLSRVKRAEYLLKVATIIERRKEELAQAISLETGKNYNESIAEVNEALHMAQYAFSLGRMPHGEAVASEISGKDSYMLRKP